MKLTLTAKIKIVHLPVQHDLLHQTVRAYREGCKLFYQLRKMIEYKVAMKKSSAMNLHRKGKEYLVAVAMRA